jgi:hypothetical protein
MRQTCNGVNLRDSLVPPRRMKFIERFVHKGRVTDTIVDAWLVLEERPKTCDGYKVIYDDRMNSFGLASPGWDTDQYPSVDGFYGDFWSAFKAM